MDAEYSATICALVSEGAGIGFVNPTAIAGLDRSGIEVLRFTPALHFPSISFSRQAVRGRSSSATS